MSSYLRVSARLNSPQALSLLLLVALINITRSVPAQSLQAQEEAAIRAAADHIADSVVQIRTIGGLDEFERTVLPDGPTTGLVISPDGWILSSAFNFVQQPASILVTFASGEQAPATLVAKDHSRKLALLKAQGVENLAVPEIVPVDEIHVGQRAIAVGRTFRADRTNLSVGIISALDRMYGKVIQTDADVSTANYGGPMVDIRGRVFGVIVPIAPQSTSEVAGAEWYDSGIGFAAPLAEIGAAIERMKRGEDQFAGLLGISMAADNPHATPAELVVVPPNTPANKAGLKKGDRIVEINGQPIRTQTDLRFAIGPLYGGDEVHVTAVRGEEKIERTLTLAGELAPFRHAFLGILPRRSDRVEKKSVKDKEELDDAKEPAGIVVRMVYPGGPAAAAGIRAGDRLLQIGDTNLNVLTDVYSVLGNVVPGADVDAQFVRDGQTRDAKIIAGRLPTNVPNDLPPAYASRSAEDATTSAALETRELKLAEFAETCQVYVPPPAETGGAAGVLLWIHAPGEPPNDDLILRWRAICDRDRLLFVAPIAANPSRWERTELEYLRRLTERVLAEYPVDRNRVVAFGQGGGGAMAYLLTLSSRDLFTGVATVDAALPRTIQVPPSEPSTRLAVFAGLPANNARLAQMRAGLRKLADAGYPVTTTTIRDGEGNLTAAEQRELAGWIDTLDRF